MKSVIVASSLFLLLSCATALAQEIDPRHYIYIEAAGSVTGPADRATVGISVTDKDDTPQAVVDASISGTTAVLDALVAAGIPREDIETRNFVFETAYIRAANAPDYGPSDPDRDTFDGYRVRNSMLVTVKDLPKLGAVLAAVAREGAEISSVGFASTKSAQYYEEARAQAAQNALAKAELYAASLKVDLGTLLSMREGTSYDPDSMEYPPSEGEADLIIPTVPIAPGNLTFTAKLSAKWEVEPQAGQ